MDRLTYEISKDEGKWTWSLRTQTGEIIAVAARAYMHKQECLDAVCLVRCHGAATTSIEESYR